MLELTGYRFLLPELKQTVVSLFAIRASGGHGVPDFSPHILRL